jgi:NAD(P)-dependent dehydrogenase (short-subunit alcohol dehydrogenase family)
MLLENKNAVIYGWGEVISGAVARTFACEGARVFLAGCTLATLDEVHSSFAWTVRRFRLKTVPPNDA